MDINGQKHAKTTVPLVTNLGTHRIGRWISLIAGLDILKKTRGLASAGTRTPNRPARSIVTILIALPLLPNEL